MKRVFFLIIVLTAAFAAQAVTVYDTEEDRMVFNRFLVAMKDKRNLPIHELLVETALYFLETPYVGATLEKEPEGLVVNLREMDCATFVDNVYSLARTLKAEQPTYELFCRYLKELRYRGEEITDYTDRLHYTTDWIYENIRKGLVHDKTKKVGGKPLALDLSFMSTHPESYKQLKGSPERIRIIAEKEQEINNRSHSYIPEEEIDALSAGIDNGDMIGFVTTTKGLDLAHVGIAYRKGDMLTFIHASSVLKKVVINEESLADYVARIKNNKGIMVVGFGN